MAISFSCDCGQEFKVSDSHAGKRIKCQGCGSAVKIPALPGKSTSDSGGVAVGKARKQAVKSAEVEDDPLVHATSDYDSAYEFDIGKVPMGKLIEDGDPDAGPRKKKSKKSGEAAEKPKKKKKQSDEEAGNPILIGVFVVLGLCSLSALGYFGFQKFGGGGDSKPLEKKFITFKHEVSGWSLEHPDDWKLQSSGGSGGAPPLVLMEGDGAIFRMKGSTGGSMIGTMMNPGGGAAPDPGGAPPAIGSPDDLSPETGIHNFQKELFSADYDQFEEEAMKKITPPFGEGRLSVFTGKEGLFSPKIKGYRATFLDTNYQYNIRAYAPETQWDKFEPTFKRMIMSLSR